MSADPRCCYIDLDGTLLGFGGSILRAGDNTPSHAGILALETLTAARVPFVFASGRSQARLEVIARLLGARGALAELGALDAGFPTAPGQTLYEAIAATGIVDALLAREPHLEIHPGALWGRTGSHCLRGVASPDTPEWVASYSDGALRFADNGHIGPGDTHVYHVLPTSATKAISVRRHLLQNAFEPARCLAIGDSAEDLEMASCVGAFALVRNGAEADPRLAARAKWITNASNGAGVLEAVTQWLEGTVVTR